MRYLALILIFSLSLSALARRRDCNQTRARAERRANAAPTRHENMSSYFGTRTGTRLKNSSRKKRANCRGGQSLFQFTSNVRDFENTRKGYFYHLDSLHYDHLEVYDKKGNFSHVANFDGTMNEGKTQQVLRGGTRDVKDCL